MIRCALARRLDDLLNSARLPSRFLPRLFSIALTPPPS
jgi:hypothetical protein